MAAEDGAFPTPKALRRAGGWVWQNRHRCSDWVFAAGLFPASLVMHLSSIAGLLSPLPPDGYYGEGVLRGLLLDLLLIPGLAAAASLAMLWRRSRPDLVLGFSAVLIILMGNIFPAVAALYSHAAWSEGRRRLAGWTVLLALLWFALSTPDSFATVVGALLFLPFLLGMPLTLGLWAGTRRRLIANLRERAERLEREQHLMAERATGAERTRIAREMHDVVAHRVSLMVLHAGGLEVSAPDARTAEAAGIIRTTGREALTELRGILGVLREPHGADAPRAPQPALSDLDALLAEWRTAGMRVERGDTGSAHLLPPQMERTAFRVVQEGLTNAAKHAPGAIVRVRLDFAASGLEVSVVNGALSSGAGHPPPEGGYGLAGLRERVALVGGELRSGPTLGGGWRLWVRLPAPEFPEPPDEDGERGEAGDRGGADSRDRDARSLGDSDPAGR